MPEQSQTPATPTPRLSDADLARAVKTVSELTTEENQKLAADELSMIEELHKSSAFRWFFAEFVDKLFQDSFAELRSEFVEDVSKAQITYRAMKQIRAGMLEREITWRARVDPNDPALPALREKLRNL